MALAPGLMHAEDEAPVSATNGLLEYLNSQVDSDNANVYGGNVTWPLSGRYRAQLDVAGGSADQDDVTGLGGHAFWHDPKVGVIDVRGSWLKWGPDSIERIGVQGKWFNPIWTLSGSVDFQTGDVKGGVVTQLDARWYPLDMLMVQGGARSLAGDNQLFLTAELQPLPGMLPPLSLVAGATSGEHDYDQVFLGVRYYIGGHGGLRQRHREELPLDTNPDWLGATLPALSLERRAPPAFVCTRELASQCVSPSCCIQPQGTDQVL
jgi:hypothetical protein